MTLAGEPAPDEPGVGPGSAELTGEPATVEVAGGPTPIDGARARPGTDTADPRLALGGPPALRPFNDAAVLSAADVHVARRLAELAGDRDDAVLLGAALAVRALRLGHVCVDLDQVHRTATTDADHGVDLSHLPWPPTATWRDRMAASALVGDGDEGAVDRPLRLVGRRLYLDRYWRQECQVADDLTARSRRPVTDIDDELLRDGLARLWPDRLWPDPHTGSPGTETGRPDPTPEAGRPRPKKGTPTPPRAAGGPRPQAGRPGPKTRPPTPARAPVGPGPEAGSPGPIPAPAPVGPGPEPSSNLCRLITVRPWQVDTENFEDAGRPPMAPNRPELRAVEGPSPRQPPAERNAGPDPGPGPGRGSETDLPRLAGAAAVQHRFVVVAGGPGTGKTTTVARILALLVEQHDAQHHDAQQHHAQQHHAQQQDAQQHGAAGSTLRVAMAAPTGKAAARLEEAVHDEARRLPVGADVRAHLAGLEASTLHRLLGWRPDSRSRFRHNRSNHLPHDVVIVDEASMVSLSLMAKLVEAVRPDARLILVGDPEQLASVEAGAVLGDIVGPAGRGLRIRADARRRLGQATGQAVPATEPPDGVTVGDGIVVLRRVHRYGGAIASLAEAIQGGDADGAVRLLRAGPADLTWIETDDTGAPPAAATLQPVRDRIVAAGRSLVEAAREGDGAGALRSLGAVRVLCAHREGPAGVGEWTERIEGWLAASIAGYVTAGPWYVGRPVLVTRNDYELALYNGDTGVVVHDAQGPRVAFERRGDLYTVSPSRLGHILTMHAMTVHKSQGSQFGAVVFALPDPSSQVLTRELLYTAVTRSQRHLTLVGSETSLRAAVGRPIARATGLRERLWDPSR